MHTFKMNFSHLFRALFLLVFGLMVGEVFGGGDPFKIKVVNNGNSTPQFSVLPDTLGATLNGVTFSENIEFGVDVSLSPGSYEMDIDIFSQSLSGNLSYICSKNADLNFLIAGKAQELVSDYLNFNATVSGSNFTSHIIFQVNIRKKNDESYFIIQNYGLPVKTIQINTSVLRKGISAKPKTSLKVRFENKQTVYFDSLTPNDYRVEIYSIGGEALFSESFSWSSLDNGVIYISLFNPKCNSVIFIRVYNVSKPSLSFTKKVFVN